MARANIVALSLGGTLRALRGKSQVARMVSKHAFAVAKKYAPDVIIAGRFINYAKWRDKLKPQVLALNDKHVSLFEHDIAISHPTLHLQALYAFKKWGDLVDYSGIDYGLIIEERQKALAASKYQAKKALQKIAEAQGKAQIGHNNTADGAK